MKILIVSLLLLAASTISYGQPNQLGKSEKQVIENMKLMDNVKFLMRGVSQVGNPYLEYFDQENTVLTYRFKNGVCQSYVVGYSMKHLPEMIKYLDSENLKLTDSTWTSKKSQYKVVLKYGQIGKDVFWLTYTGK